MTSESALIVCPECRGPLDWSDASVNCIAERREFRIVDGIADFVPDDRREAIEAFLARYLEVRHAERWTDDDLELLHALPFRDVTKRRQAMWNIRARGLAALTRELARTFGDRRLIVCEIGAGVGWLSYRLAMEGNTCVAADVNVDARDGLGAARHYVASGIDLTRVRAPMDRLPVASGLADVVVGSASFHYAVDEDAQRRVLAEAARVLRPGGLVAILDSPVYRSAASGERMVAEWRDASGTSSATDVRDSGYLVRDEIERAIAGAGLTPEFRRHWMGWRWTANFIWQRWFGPREPAMLPMILGRMPPAS